METSAATSIIAAGFAFLVLNLIAGTDIFTLPNKDTASTIGLAIVVVGSALLARK